MQHIQKMIPVGKSNVYVSPLGMGTLRWGETHIWGFGSRFTREDLETAYHLSREAGINFFDTAEIYGDGVSETILGALVQQDRNPVVIATKFAPLRSRWTSHSVERALNASTRRLGTAPVDLYQIHWPARYIRFNSLMNAMADQVEAGKTRAIGVSNFSASQMYRAYSVLAKRGIPLASNQVHYSLLHREPERNGVLEACRELGVQLIAYSPLEQGILTGKYHENGIHIPSDTPGASSLHSNALYASTSLIERLYQMGEFHGHKTPAQIALNWLMRQGALPIPGATTASQAASNAQALGWELTDEEVEELNAYSIDTYA